MKVRKVKRVVSGQPATDGAGVELVRVIGQPALMDLDPFLLLDAFRSDDPDDYIAGFPAHPHRGFETVTYLLNGRMRHRDNAGNEGVIEPGGIQWMTAGKGIVHSEMPEQQDGLLEGFQLWINLPAAHKMTAPAYQEYGQANIPTESREGAEIRVITGTTTQGTQGPVKQPLTDPLYLDVTLAPGAGFTEAIDDDHTAFLYVIDGVISVEDENGDPLQLRRDQLAVLGTGDSIQLHAADASARLLLIAGRPLNEPVARGGPFVMNTADEVRQAFSDYQRGDF
jgi:hypothetical protein